MNFNSITELQDFIIEKSLPFESFDAVLLYIYYKSVQSNCHVDYFYLPVSKNNNKIEDETKFKEYIKLKVSGIPLNKIWKIEIRKETSVDGKYNININEYIVDNTFNAKNEQEKCRDRYQEEKRRAKEKESLPKQKAPIPTTQEQYDEMITLNREKAEKKERVKDKNYGKPGRFGKSDTLQRLNNEIKYLIALKK
jgi:hypothetical protein